MRAARTLTARCPAKVNLALRVLARRQDGYHEIETLFQAVDLWDEIDASEASELTLSCDDPALPVDASNLVLRAAIRLREAFAPDATARLELRKRIPSGGGLGGGSSDAAGTLLLLARLWGLRVSREDLERIAAGLGADVPFFLHGGTALGTGRGDRIRPLEPLGDAPILLGCPPYGISTAEVYQALPPRLTPLSNGVSLRRFLAYKWPSGKDFRFAVNDLEEVVFRSRPELATFREALRSEGASLALLSGSGSSVFGLFADARRLREVIASLKERFAGWRLYSTRAVPVGASIVDSGKGLGSGRRGE